MSGLVDQDEINIYKYLLMVIDEDQRHRDANGFTPLDYDTGYAILLDLVLKLFPNFSKKADFRIRFNHLVISAQYQAITRILELQEYTSRMQNMPNTRSRAISRNNKNDRALDACSGT